MLSSLSRTNPSSFSRTRPGLALLALLLALALPNSSDAQQWRVAPVVSVGIEYDDNASLLPDNVPVDRSADAYEAEGLVRFIYSSELTNLYFTPMLRFSRFNGQSNLDADDKFLDFGLTRSGEVSRLRLRGAVSDESIRTAERSDVDFDVEDPDDIPIDDSAQVLETNSRQRTRMFADYRREVGRRSALGFRFDFVDLNYDENVIGFLEDYSSTRLQGWFEIRSSERDSLELRVQHRTSDLDSGANPTGNSATLGWIRRFSETSRLVLRAGVDSSEDVDGRDESNPVGQISFMRNFEVAQFLASYRRSIAGGGGNVLSVRDEISANFRRQLSQRLQLGLGARAYKTRPLNSQAANTFDNRDYVQLRGLLSWRLTKSFFVDLDYRYTFLDREIFPDEAVSNRFNLWFRWSPKHDQLQP